MITFSQYLIESTEFAIISRLKQQVSQALASEVESGAIKVSVENVSRGPKGRGKTTGINNTQRRCYILHISDSEKHPIINIEVSQDGVGRNSGDDDGEKPLEGHTEVAIVEKTKDKQFKQFARTRLVAIVKKTFNDAKISFENVDDAPHYDDEPKHERNFWAQGTSNKDPVKKSHPDERTRGTHAEVRYRRDHMSVKHNKDGHEFSN